jgi:hypothetical protein
VETAANGTGTVVPAQSQASGSSVTVYSITRDASNNFVSNAAATAWTLENITGGVLAGDLVAAVDSKSATFTGHVVGSAEIKATSGALTATSSGAITVTPGTAAKVRVETAANGTGTVVPSQPMVSGSSVTVYSITRDASDNFVANAAATVWTLENITGGISAGDLVAAVDGKSAIFTGHVVGSADIKATSGALPADPSGIISVIPGAAAKVRVETAADGSGAVVPAQSLTFRSSVTVYSITRDASGNFLANLSAASWALENITGGVVPGDLVPAVDNKSATFTGHVIGSADIIAVSGALQSTPSGMITVLVPATQDVQNVTLGSGQSNCFDAIQTVFVAGNGTTFVVQAGGSATTIAGQNIVYLPGTTVNPGGYLHGYITTTGEYCGMAPLPFVAVKSGEVEKPISKSQPYFRVFPNPTSGNFTIDVKDESETGSINVQIFGMRGDKVLNSELPGNGKYELSLSGKPSGIYIIRVISGNSNETTKIIKQ